MGGLAMSDNNLTPRIEQLAPELEKIISASEPIERLADGFGGAQGPAEGRCGGRTAATTGGRSTSPAVTVLPGGGLPCRSRTDHRCLNFFRRV
jgi:hypothetical protein